MAAAAASSARGAPAGGASADWVVPYDHAASFRLAGRPGNVVQDIINVSADGVFVATAIGYGLEEERTRPIQLSLPAQPELLLPSDIRLGQLPPDALLEGFRVNPRFDALVFPAEDNGGRGERAFSTTRKIPVAFANQLFEKLRPPADLSFLFSVVDSGTGREFQDEPVQNIASLGTSTGLRPFRPLAPPLSFLPRSTLRLQVIEQTANLAGTLFVALYGYKILGATARSEAAVRALSTFPPAEAPRPLARRVIPFDYVTTFELTGRTGNLVTDEVVVNVEGGFVATAIGYGLAVAVRRTNLRQSSAAASLASNGKIDLAAVPLKALPAEMVSEGLRIRRDFVRLAFQDNGSLGASFPLDQADEIFESINRSEDVSFRYSIFDSGRGCELQNQPIHNIAGLGIADGSRPFKRLARPLKVLPRSTLRVTVEERFGRGVLYIVFQGYKQLEAGSPVGRT